ncbi:MAG: replication initiation protein, partial [Paracoccaceae bacterium]
MSDIDLAAQHEEFFHPADVPDSFKKAIGVVQVAMGKLGFLHRKLYNVMLANAYEGLGQGRMQFSIPASMMAELAGFDSNNYQVLYDHCRELMQTEVLTVDFDKRQKGTGRRRTRRRGGTTLLADFDVVEGGVISYSFSPKMAQLLHEPDQYIWMALSVQSKFSSKYELSLFENCIRYIGVKTTGFKDVADWRSVLGAEDPTYDQFKDFNKKVLKPAIQGVNSKSGIIIDPEFEREKRRVARIKFNVREDPQLSLLDHRAHSQIRQTDAYKAVRAVGLDDVVAIHFIETKGEEAVCEAVAYVREKAPKNPGGYLISALKSGYGQKTLADRERQALSEARAAERAAARAGKPAPQLAELAAHLGMDDPGGNITYALRMLERQGALGIEKSGNLRRYTDIASGARTGWTEVKRKAGRGPAIAPAP